MNMIDIQDKLKNLSEDQLIREMQAPSGQAPQFLVLSEITRRKKMRDGFKAQEAKQGVPSVAEEVIASAGVPQQGMPGMAQAMAPKSSIAQNTGIGSLQPQRMASGGLVRKMAEGGTTYATPSLAFLRDPAIVAMANRMGVRPSQLWRNFSEEERQQYENRRPDLPLAVQQNLFPMEQPMPTQEDLDRAYVEESLGFGASRPMQPPSMDAPPQMPRRNFAPNLSPAPQIDLDLAGDAVSPSASAAPPTMAGMRLMGLEPQMQPNSDLTNQILDQLEYGFDPGSERRMTAEEILAASAGQPVSIPALPPDVGKASEVPDTQLSIDPYTGKVSQLPGLRKQMEMAGEAIGDLSIDLPTFDMSRGNPYSELSDAETEALFSGNLTPEQADALQAGRLAMREYGRGTSGAMSAEAPTAEDAEKTEAGDTTSKTTPQTTSEAPLQPLSDVLGGGGAGTGQGGSGGAAGAAGASGSGGYISELEDALKRMERTKEQDKWLALAQTGLALMASDQPTLGGAIGEAGQVGIDAFRNARDTYEEGRMSILEAIAAQRAAAARAASAGGRGRSGVPSLSDVRARINDISEEVKVMDDNGIEQTIRRPTQGFEDEYVLLQDLYKRNLSQLYGLNPIIDATQ